MFNSAYADSLPKPAACLSLGVLPPYYQRNKLSWLVNHDVVVETCHVVTDGRLFNFRKAYDMVNEFNYIHFKQFSYTDPQGQTLVVDVSSNRPHLINKKGETVCGYVTKINGKRWGVTVTLDWDTGAAQVLADQGSPITGVLFQFIED